ncbi:three-helix bundle dimerization domain-containing protein [Flindersiella endophytica]
MSSDRTGIHPPDQAIDHVIDTLADRFPEDRATVSAIVHRIHNELRAQAAIDTHLLPLTQHQATDELRARHRR